MAERTPFDDVVAAALRRAVGEPQHDVTDVLARGAQTRRARTRRALVISGVAGLGVASVVAALVLRSQPTTPQPVHRAPAIEGTYRAQVHAAGRQAALDGRWQLTFTGDGTVEVVAPRTYTGTFTGVSYRVAGDVMRTDLLVQDLCSGDSIGSYRWQRAGSSLRLRPVTENCAARSRLLSGQEWIVAR